MEDECYINFNKIVDEQDQAHPSLGRQYDVK